MIYIIISLGILTILFLTGILLFVESKQEKKRRALESSRENDRSTTFLDYNSLQHRHISRLNQINLDYQIREREIERQRLEQLFRFETYGEIMSDYNKVQSKKICYPDE